MNDDIEKDEIVTQDTDGQDLEDMIGRMQQKLGYLEKKIDILY